MRVEDRSGVDATRLGSASETQQTRQPSLGGQSDASGSPDRFQLSSLAGRIRDVLAGASQAHAARVAQVASQLRNGTYRVDREALSRALASEALG